MSTEKKTENKKADNDIRIGMKSRQRYVIKYASSIMKEKNYKELKFSAVGGSIGKLLDIVEVLKVLIPGLYQQNRITSVAYQTVDSNSTILNQRLYPKLEVILSTEEFKNKNEGTQDKLDEKTRKDLEEVMKKRREEREKNAGGKTRGRGGFRGGRRPGFRGRRPGFRGRGSRRGGFRGRGRGPRGAVRGRGRGRGQGGRGQGQRGAPKVNRGRGAK
jgi:DNA-binding protein